MTPPTPRRQGRPRDERPRKAVLDATRDLLLEQGYHRMTIEAVAARAGTTRSTIYRWWSSRGALALEAVADRITIDPVPDTGNSRDDLLAAIDSLTTTFSDPLTRVVMLAVVAGLDDDPTLAAQFRQTAVYPWRQTAHRALVRAAERGDLPDRADPESLLNVIVGTVFQCAVTTAQPATDGLAQALADLVLTNTPG